MNILKRIRESVDYRIIQSYVKSQFPPLDISNGEAAGYTFCFLGEFGFELFCWVPYLKFLKKNVDFRMRIAGRKGGQPFYDFADEYAEISNGYFGQGMGQAAHYYKAKRELGIAKLFNPVESQISGENGRRLSVEGIAYSIGSLYRSSIEYRNASPLDLSRINDKLPFKTTKPIVVIANKSYSQFGRYAIVNFFVRDELRRIRDNLVAKGYFVVYNHFPEPKNEGDDREFAIDASAIFSDPDNCFNLEEVYRSSLPGEKINRLQISLYNSSSAVIATQGGTSYLPAICRKPVFCLMRHGYYNEIKNLSTVYAVPIKACYEVDDLLIHLDQYLVNR